MHAPQQNVGHNHRVSGGSMLRLTAQSCAATCRKTLCCDALGFGESSHAQVRPVSCRGCACNNPSINPQDHCPPADEYFRAARHRGRIPGHGTQPSTYSQTRARYQHQS